jgi:hypothetical protein
MAGFVQTLRAYDLVKWMIAITALAHKSSLTSDWDKFDCSRTAPEKLLAFLDTGWKSLSKYRFFKPASIRACGKGPRLLV